MVTAKTQYSLTNAKDYFAEHLCVGDYYAEGQRVLGLWFGLGAERLGLAGEVQADPFLRLCENQHPATGETLTQRLKTTRVEDGQSTANRRIFYDFTFSPPKSVSLAAFLGNDRRILEGHSRAVRSALREFESFAATRIRVAGAQQDRSTGNFVAALFTHDTSRSLDPHLHTHCIVFNATFDTAEDRWKALQNHELLRARKFAENAYYHELARQLRAFGYRIQNRMRGDFQIEGVSAELCERFSKRHAQIDAALEKLLTDKPDLKRAEVMALRRHLAAAERSRKQRNLSRDELRRLWNAQTTAEERAALQRLATGSVPVTPNQPRQLLTEAVQWAEEHLFDRQSVVMECQIWQEALGRARGEDFSLDDLKDQTRRRGYLRQPKRPHDVTLHEVLLREWEIVRIVREGTGDFRPLSGSPHQSQGTSKNSIFRKFPSTNHYILDKLGNGLTILDCKAVPPFGSFGTWSTFFNTFTSPRSILHPAYSNAHSPRGAPTSRAG